MRVLQLCSFSWRMLRRDARGGELRLLAAALGGRRGRPVGGGIFCRPCSSGARSRVSSIARRRSLADRRSSVAQALTDEARARGLQVVETRTFPSMGERRRAARAACAARRDQGGWCRLSAARHPAHCAGAECPGCAGAWRASCRNDLDRRASGLGTGRARR